MPRYDEAVIEEPPRFLGLDLGTKRIGVAVSDALGLLAHPLLTVYRKGGREDLRSVARLARRHGCSAFVIGNPLHMSGEQSPAAAKAQRFAEGLRELTGLAVHLWDERLTTAAAHEILYAAGRARAKHQAVVDQVAAVLILQGFLDFQREAPRATPGEVGV